jgi:hypothetical protein
LLIIHFRPSPHAAGGVCYWNRPLTVNTSRPLPRSDHRPPQNTLR